MQLRWLLVFYSFSRRFNNESLCLLSPPEQSINTSRFLGITKWAHKAAAAHLCFTCSRAESCSKSARTYSHSASVLRNSLDWNINLPRKRHCESETSSNLMQEKTAIWLGRANLKQALFVLSGSSLYIDPFFPPPVNATIKVMCSSA